MLRLFIMLALTTALVCRAQCRKSSVTEENGATATGELCKVKIKPTYGSPYLKDVKSGEWTFNNENNMLYMKGLYQKKGDYSSKEGDWIWYNEDGVAFVKVLYVNDRPKKLFVLDTGLARCGDDSVKVSTADNIHYTTLFVVKGQNKQWVADNLIEEFLFEEKTLPTSNSPINGIVGRLQDADITESQKNKDNIIWSDREILEIHIPQVRRLLSTDTARISPEINLIENPDFVSERKQIPDGNYGLSKGMIPGWEPFSQSPDLFVSEGKAVIGFRTAGINYEIVKGHLKTPLLKDKIYCFSMRVKLKYDNNYTSSSIGALIAKPGSQAINRDNAQQFGTLILSPENSPPALRDSWMTIKGSFKATGGEDQLFISQFSGGKKVRYWPLDSIYSGTSGEIYFYFKDAALYEISSSLPCNCTVDQCDSTPTPQPVDEVLVFKNIQFKTGDWQLLETSFSSLDSLYEYLSGKDNFTLEIVGHTDNQGDATDNLKLSEKRAKAVYDYLVKAGADKNRLKYTGKGDTQPIADNEEEEGRMANRRVEFYLKQP